MNDLLGNLQMLEMALNQIKEYSSNEWVVGGGYRYNINTVLYQIKEGEPIHPKSKMFDETVIAPSGCSETYSEQMQSELEPISEPLDSKLKLYNKTGVASSGCVMQNNRVTHIGGIALDWTFHTTDDDCEFENG